MEDNLHSLPRRLIELRIEHADLDNLIDRATADAGGDDLSLRRLKKRRLLAARSDGPHRSRARTAAARMSGAATPRADDRGGDAMSPLQHATHAALADGGALAAADPHHTERREQLQMASAVAAAIDLREPLVVEAGTGVGKTYAYLVPALLSGARTLLSTATKTLQDQLFLRDLPRLRDALGVPVTIALLKGRSSYLCTHRLGLARQDAQLPDRFAVRALARIEAWAQTTASGDLAELEGLDERSSVMPLVTSSRENCLGSECPQFKGCHVNKARRDAMAADLVVVNHHLFFADLALRDSGVAELLPSVEVAVFDEAHQLGEAGVQFLGTILGSSQLIDFARDMLAVGLQQARGLLPWPELASACDRSARDLRLAAVGRLGEVRAGPEAALGRAQRRRGLRRRPGAGRRGLRSGARGARDGERARARLRSPRRARGPPCGPGAAVRRSRPRTERSAGST